MKLSPLYLQAYEEKAHRELCRMRDEQQFWKMKVYTDF